MRISNNLPGLYRYPANVPRQAQQALHDNDRGESGLRGRVPAEVVIEGELVSLPSTPALAVLQPQRSLANPAVTYDPPAYSRAQTAIDRYVNVSANGKQPAVRLNVVV